MVRVEQGGAAKWTLNATDGTVENKTTTQVFSYCKANSSREMAKEQ
jgi:hypothetical protein